ncbi:RNA-binding transcriptional accessory protein [Nitrosomonas sp. JL21]|uniref:Tex family protein n=1 Tax=Nitrosomonas sp. JL21 TaxID=153949 RepID=UPI00136C097C|nr:Tex family protein [Nitrosomonas sp. JL21]MBL8497468.1 RNA-binding transcriptional accessory protein [Nitrosomonas sp.]MXS78905.1 RNA-binding transcriptional accessory protein [Nitrosomonas sp. JL21]
MLPSIEQRLATELAVKTSQVQSTVQLLDDGATVPFIARYRKEATGGLDDAQLRVLAERLHSLRELEKRRAAIITAIEKLGKMTPPLLDALTHATDKALLEDLYLPYRKKRRTKAQIALEAGLQPLADSLLNDPRLDPLAEAAKYLKAPFTSEEGDNPGVADAAAALEGAQHILIERFAEHAPLLQTLRDYLRGHGVLTAKAVKDKKDSDTKYTDYHDYSEAISKIPSHRALALLRGEREGMLKLKLLLDTELENKPRDVLLNPCELMIARAFNIRDQKRAADGWLIDTVRQAWRTKIFAHLETELMGNLLERAETEAIKVFAQNLKALLLAPPAGTRVTIGLDPGLRTGVKVAVVDATGKVLDTTAIYPHAPKNDWDGALHTLRQLAERHQASLIAIGNGTASRETDQLAKELIKRHSQLKLTSIMVSEAGASVYSASELASEELPDLDVSLRGAVSIARRLQDPLAELVKIDPKSIGVGQYQHDVNQNQLAQSLDAVVEDSVNAVGVDVNTASPALLRYVAGLNSKIAHNIVAYRDSKGRFGQRAELLKVPSLGAKTFEQAAGFLRIADGDNPLDASAVHPESYSLVERILRDVKLNVAALIGNTTVLKAVRPEQYTNERFGLPTIKDILHELEKPGRDPRATFKTATFKEGVETLQDLHPGMVLEGVVTNVAAFGAFVDIGVHQDGLVHISALADQFVKDPHAIVKVGQVVTVKVVEVDEKRKRIALTMRLKDRTSS